MFKMRTRTFEIGINEITINIRLSFWFAKVTKNQFTKIFIINQECKILDVFMLVCFFAYC